MHFIDIRIMPRLYLLGFPIMKQSKVNVHEIEIMIPSFIIFIYFLLQFLLIISYIADRIDDRGAVMVVIAWLLDIQLPVQSVSITTTVVSSNPAHCKVYSIQHYVIKFVSYLLQIGGFLWVLRFPPPIKLTATIYLKCC